MSSRSTRVRRVPCRSFPSRRACPLADIATQVILGKTLQRAGHHRSLRQGEETLVRQGPGFLVRQDPRDGCLPVARDEVHRRGHRLRRQTHPRALQGAAGHGHERRQLRHDLRHHRRPRTRSRRCPSCGVSTTWASTSRPRPGTAEFLRNHGIRTRVRAAS